jgi:hypothetical protein
MKLRLLFFATFLSLMSCSEDDGTTPVSVPTTENLKQITYYNTQDDDADGIDAILKFQENKLVERHLFNLDGEAYLEDYYTYDSNGRMVTHIANVYQDGSETFDQTFEYDAIGRLTLAKNTYNGTYTEESFDYSVANKITKTTSYFFSDGMNDYSVIEVFDLLPDGRVYKITGEYLISQVEYAGNNIVLRIETDVESGETVTYNYTYDMQTAVKGHYLNYVFDNYGENKANHVIKTGHFSVAKDNFMTSGDGYVKEYEFNNNGYPVKDLFYVDGVLQYKYEITYE